MSQQQQRQHQQQNKQQQPPAGACSAPLIKEKEDRRQRVRQRPRCDNEAEDHDGENRRAEREVEAAFVLLRDAQVRLLPRGSGDYGASVKRAAAVAGHPGRGGSSDAQQPLFNSTTLFHPVQIVGRPKEAPPPAPQVNSFADGLSRPSRMTGTTAAEPLHGGAADEGGSSDPWCECCFITIVVGRPEPSESDDVNSSSTDINNENKKRHKSGVDRRKAECGSNSEEEEVEAAAAPAVRNRQAPLEGRATYELDWDQVVGFTGLESDRQCRCGSGGQEGGGSGSGGGGKASSNTMVMDTCGRRRPPLRSDAALLFGLLKSVQDVVSFGSCFLQVHGPSTREDTKEEGVADANGNGLGKGPPTVGGNDDRDGTLRSCSILVTLRFPHLLPSAPAPASHSSVHDELLSILPSATSTSGSHHQASRSRPVNKPLSPALQLLLALCRSDWEALPPILQQQQGSVSRDRRIRTPFFPPKLSLEHLYEQLRSSSNDDDDSRIASSRRSSSEPSSCSSSRSSLLLGLPTEVLQNRISGFLTAKDLDAIRGSCKFLHSALETIVPGLKLKLYRHQISSLSWMRRRECRAMWEADLLTPPRRALPPEGGDANLPCCYEGRDRHGPATGGGTVLLRPRPSTVVLPQAAEAGATARSCSVGERPVRICTTFGNERNWIEEAETDPRCDARGGLLWYVTFVLQTTPELRANVCVLTASFVPIRTARRQR
jgi:hypothetical protein